MEAHDSAAPLQVSLHRGLVDEEPGISLVDHQNVRIFEVRGGRRMKCAIHDSSALSQQFAPIGKELWIIVLARGVRLQSCPEKDAHAICVLAGYAGRGSGRLASRRQCEHCNKKKAAYVAFHGC